jgi:hypothetical protein
MKMNTMKLVVEKMESLAMERVETKEYARMFDVKVNNLVEDAFVEVTGRKPTLLEVEKMFNGKALYKVIKKVEDSLKK